MGSIKHTHVLHDDMCERYILHMLTPGALAHYKQVYDCNTSYCCLSMCAVIFRGWNRFVLVGAERCCSRSDHAHVLATYFWSSNPTINQPAVSHGSRERYLEPIATMNQALPWAQEPTKPVTTASIRVLKPTHNKERNKLTIILIGCRVGPWLYVIASPAQPLHSYRCEVRVVSKRKTKMCRCLVSMCRFIISQLRFEIYS